MGARGGGWRGDAWAARHCQSRPCPPPPLHNVPTCSASKGRSNIETIKHFEDAWPLQQTAIRCRGSRLCCPRAQFFSSKSHWSCHVRSTRQLQHNVPAVRHHGSHHSFTFCNLREESREEFSMRKEGSRARAQACGRRNCAMARTFHGIPNRCEQLRASRFGNYLRVPLGWSPAEM